MLVKCIDVKDVESQLILNRVYKAEHHKSALDHYIILLDGSRVSFKKVRFEELQVFKVRSQETVRQLVDGQIYEVVQHPTAEDCWLVDPYVAGVNGYSKARFTDPIDDRVPMESRPLKVDDLIEARYRKILTTRAYPNECDCGTNRWVCPYHKDQS